jgi:hypothetical protein
MSVKISQLTTSSAITSDDFFPVVDSGSLTTQRASAQQILNYVTASTFNSLTVTALTSSAITGSTAIFTTLTSSAALFTTLSGTNGNISGDLTVGGKITAQEYYTEFVSASIIYESGSTKFGNDSTDTHQFSGSVSISGTLTANNTISGTIAQFIILSASDIRTSDQRVDDVLDTNFLRISGTNIVTDVYQDTSTRMVFDSSAQHFQFFKLSTPVTAGFGNASTPLVKINGLSLELGNSSSIVSISGQLTASNITASSIYVSGGPIYGQVAELTSSTTNYTLVASDSGKFLLINSASSVNLTVPSGLPTGFTLTFCQGGAGQITVVTGSGVTINNSQGHTKTYGIYSVASLIGTGSNSYILAGDTTW